MTRARRFRAAAVALLPIATAVFVLLFFTADSQARGVAGNCGGLGVVAVLPSPIAPWTGAPLRVLFVADKPLDGVLALVAPDGSTAARSKERHGGPPYFWYAEVASPAAGAWRATLSRGGAPASCKTLSRAISVRGAKPPPPPAASPASVWPLRRSWNRASEDLYAAWIEKLFDAPLDTEPSWKSWDVVLRDRSRNVLFDYLGLGEDGMLGRLRPDCADFVYFLRAYFAFKLGLPFGYSKCSRGKSGRPPKCYGWFNTVEAKATGQRGLAATFGHYLAVVADGVQSGNGRVLATDNNTDFYSVPLTQRALRPGTIYADPYGHILTLVRRVPESGGAAGVFLAVDAEPDGTVTRKRFWRGNFLFVHDPSLGSPGFKHFRPIEREKNGALRRLTNAEITKDPQYGDFSLMQSRLGVQDFYDRMDDVMSPEPVDPLRAMQAAVTALEEQVQTRVVAVENGRKYQNAAHGTVAMPDGPAIFETTGPWEDYSTPARDFRLLIAIDVVRGFPEHVARRPRRYAMPAGKSVAAVKAELQRALAAQLAASKFTYPRSDGSTCTIALKDVVDRETALEMDYNPNDCVELRWGAPPDSKEASTCKRHAPAAQRARMTKYRIWFEDRRWPTTHRNAMAKKPRQAL